LHFPWSGNKLILKAGVTKQFTTKFNVKLMYVRSLQIEEKFENNALAEVKET
jgi:hypothetical protein